MISMMLCCLFFGTKLHAQDAYVGEIRMFAGNFAPRGWAFCDGQLLAISSNSALFSLLGTQYGGNGSTTFALPDMRGRLPVHHGQGPGLSAYQIGEQFGQENIRLITDQLAGHTHPVWAVSEPGAQATVLGGYPANTQTQDPEYAVSGTRVPMNAAAGGNNVTANNTVNNKQPSLGIHYIIALQGIYPTRD